MWVLDGFLLEYSNHKLHTENQFAKKLQRKPISKHIIEKIWEIDIISRPLFDFSMILSYKMRTKSSGCLSILLQTLSTIDQIIWYYIYQVIDCDWNIDRNFRGFFLVTHWNTNQAFRSLKWVISDDVNRYFRWWYGLNRTELFTKYSHLRFVVSVIG